MLEIGLYAGIAPLGLLLLSSIWSYPAYLEEVIKWLILKNSNHSSDMTGRAGFVVGLGFGLSEWVLYLSGAWMSGNYMAMLVRLCLTVPMHAITGMITGMRVGRREQYLFLIMAIMIHALFNYIVGLRL